MVTDYDPRFDPAFQRGFDGSSGNPGTVESSRLKRSMVERAVVERDVVQPVQTYLGEIRSATVERSETARNPWLHALWVIAAVLIVGGVAGQWISQDLFSTGASSGSVISSYVLPSVLQSLSPWFLVAGLIAAIAAVTIHAVRWRPPEP